MSAVMVQVLRCTQLVREFSLGCPRSVPYSKFEVPCFNCSKDSRVNPIVDVRGCVDLRFYMTFSPPPNVAETAKWSVFTLMFQITKYLDNTHTATMWPIQKFVIGLVLNSLCLIPFAIIRTIIATLVSAPVLYVIKLHHLVKFGNVVFRHLRKCGQKKGKKHPQHIMQIMNELSRSPPENSCNMYSM